MRVRRAQTTVLDGPFAETKEVLAGFNRIEAGSIDEAVRMAQDFPWVRLGCIEVRALRGVAALRARVGAPLGCERALHAAYALSSTSKPP